MADHTRQALAESGTARRHMEKEPKMAALPHAPQSASIRSSSVMSQSLLHIGQSVIPDILRLSRGCPRRHREAQTVSTGRVSGPACFAARVRRTHEKLPTGSRRVAWRVPERERLASEHRKGGGPGDRSLGPPAEHRVRCPASDALMSGARASARPAPQRSDTRTDRLPALCMHRGVLACPRAPAARGATTPPARNAQQIARGQGQDARRARHRSPPPRPHPTAGSGPAAMPSAPAAFASTLSTLCAPPSRPAQPEHIMPQAQGAQHLARLRQRPRRGAARQGDGS